MTAKRIAIVSDLHCGHINGIADPKRQRSEDSEGCWKLLRRFCRMYGPFHAVMVGGDTIEGKGGFNRGVELTFPDMMDQSNIAIAVLDSIPVVKKAPWYFAGGTPCHTGIGEDFERIVAGSFGSVVTDIAWAHVAGIRARMRHKVSRAKNNMAAQIDTHIRRVGAGLEPQADILLYGHLHTYRMESQSINGRAITAMTLPALQGHTNYGGRQCEGDVSIGCVCLVVEKNVISAIYPHIASLAYDTWGNAAKKGLL
jgi:hypothetical protein